MSDINQKVIAIQGNPVSSIEPETGQILKWNGQEWLPQNEGQQLDGYGVNEFTDNGALINIIATEEILGGTSRVPVKKFTAELIGANADFNSAAIYSIPTGIQNWNVSVVGLNRNHNEDFYKSDLNFLVVNQGVIKIMAPMAPDPTNLITNGDGDNWKAIATLMSHNTHIAVQGATGTNWSVYGTVQELITASTPTFLPSNIDNLIVWLSADYGITLDGYNVVNWTDQSPEHNDVSQSTNELQPIFNATDINFNDEATISFNGNQWLDVIESQEYSEPNTIIICGNWSGSIDDNMIVGSADGGNRNDLFAHTATQIGLYDGGSVLSGGSILLSNPVVAAGIFDGVDSSTYMNDSQTPAATGALNGGSWSALKVGATLTDSQPMTGTIAEIIAYNKVLSSSELQQVFLYLGTKYNITTS